MPAVVIYEKNDGTIFSINFPKNITGSILVKNNLNNEYMTGGTFGERSVFILTNVYRHFIHNNS